MNGLNATIWRWMVWMQLSEDEWWMEDEWFECNYMKMNGLNVTIWRWMVWM